MVENGLDVGFAYDGDADRCLCVDEKGKVVYGDHILYVYGRYMKDRGKLTNNTVVTTVMSNFGLYKALDELGIDYAKTAVGDKYVYEYMMTNGCRLGGEQCGHIIFSEIRFHRRRYSDQPEDDGSDDGEKTAHERTDQRPEDLSPGSEKCPGARQGGGPGRPGGAWRRCSRWRMPLGDTGRILVRESGTEPLIRVMVEAESEEQCHAYVDQVVDVIRARGHELVQ